MSLWGQCFTQYTAHFNILSFLQLELDWVGNGGEDLHRTRTSQIRQQGPKAIEVQHGGLGRGGACIACTPVQQPDMRPAAAGELQLAGMHAHASAHAHQIGLVFTQKTCASACTQKQICFPSCRETARFMEPFSLYRSQLQEPKLNQDWQTTRILDLQSITARHHLV